ncbi:MAG: Rid family hydrolase [Armatimonadota bacterium]|nr:Rid family hydrolase [Armatimonadota bacterium]
MATQKIEYVIPPASKQFCEAIRFAEGVKVGNMLYLAGQVGWNPETGKVVEGGLPEQARRAFSNMKTVIEQAGGKMDDIVQLMMFVADTGSGKSLMDDLGVVFEIKKEFVPKGMPCGTGVRVKGLALPELLVEIQAVVAL